VLTDLKIVEREIPLMEEQSGKSKRGSYQLMDHFFRCWFEFGIPQRRDLEVGEVETVERKIKQGFPLNLATVYENVAPASTLTWLRQENCLSV
jgi:hypothetical protein